MNRYNRLGHVCGSLSGLLLWFAWLRFGRVNKPVATAVGTGALGVIAMDRGLAQSVKPRA